MFQFPIPRGLEEELAGVWQGGLTPISSPAYQVAWLLVSRFPPLMYISRAASRSAWLVHTASGTRAGGAWSFSVASQSIDLKNAEFRISDGDLLPRRFFRSWTRRELINFPALNDTRLGGITRVPLISRFMTFLSEMLDHGERPVMSSYARMPTAHQSVWQPPTRSESSSGAM
eukprot:CAMPEP_0172590574 /NCGR_PEP_ID=MMETSP1068-20121228/9117_1 /TAXON_ID=35684 /ORGANISM="Pseudopedinella elastica, Strain CCMP716" /LENGTH=172 /DNA_ID=CAMNT_0013386521 /DNA_START=308 /DNA_END=826 /DNA_ORIENTATION=-